MRLLKSRFVLRVGLPLFLLLASVSEVVACSVCFSAKNEASRTAFIITTAGLTFLPLLLIGWGVRWVVLREREIDTLEAEQRTAAQDERLLSPNSETSAL